EVLATVKAIKEKANLTVISITHDIDEAANANRIIVIKNGEVIQEGTPEEIFASGEKLIEMGLDLPFPEKLKLSLKERGIDVPAEYLTEEGMVDWLWTLFSKK
ncbi:MAG: energy-coupling factor ABC transporter ATP-binding protein, partial [Carnobacterium sp.]